MAPIRGLMRTTVTMSMTMAMTMAATDLLHGQLRQFLPGKTVQVRGDGAGLGLIHFESCLHETREGPGTNPAHSNGVDGLSTERSEWPTGPVTMLLVAIDHLGDRAIVSLDDEKHRRRAKVIEDPAFKAVILCHRETDFHDCTSSVFCVYAHYLRGGRLSTHLHTNCGEIYSRQLEAIQLAVRFK